MGPVGVAVHDVLGSAEHRHERVHARREQAGARQGEEGA
jgi:hypothetical protein